MPEEPRRILIRETVSGFGRSVSLSAIGDVVEWFDFMIYLSLAPILAQVFFTGGARLSLLLTLGIFSPAFLARPIGALFFGHFGDRMGRWHALVASALLMQARPSPSRLLPITRDVRCQRR